MARTKKLRGAAETSRLLAHEEKMKQYLIVNVVEGLNQIANWIALPGLYTWETAQQFVIQAAAADPNSRFLIQEVGAA
jgi:hypothetical protein